MGEWYLWKRIKGLKKKLRSVRFDYFQLIETIKNRNRMYGMVLDENERLKHMLSEINDKIRGINRESALLPPKKKYFSGPKRELTAFRPIKLNTTFRDFDSEKAISLSIYKESMITLDVECQNEASPLYRAFHFKAKFEQNGKYKDRLYYTCSEETVMDMDWSVLMELKAKICEQFESCVEAKWKTIKGENQ